MPASGAPPPGSLSAVEIAGLVEQHAKVECRVVVTSLLGPLVSRQGTREVPALVEKDTKVESTPGVPTFVGAAEEHKPLSRAHPDACHR